MEPGTPTQPSFLSLYHVSQLQKMQVSQEPAWTEALEGFTIQTQL